MTSVQRVAVAGHEDPEGAPADVGALLGTGTGAPVLAFDRVSYSGTLAIEHSRSWYRSDRYSLTMEVRL